MIRKSVLLSLFLLSAPLFAVDQADVIPAANRLPKGSFDSSDHGRLCESLGVQKLQEEMPGATILNGVEYRKKKRVVGELDLVVVRNKVVTHVIEVKCMASYHKVAHKADEQLDRFERHAGRCKDVSFSLHGKPLDCEMFSNPNIVTGKMSYSDAHKAGFDYDFSVTREELLNELEKLHIGH